MQTEFLALKQHLQSVIVGQESLLDRLLVALLTGGHVLLEGPPGLAKTTAVKALASGVHASFQRIQFTPDLMPSDVVGSEVLDMDTHRLRFSAGPIFHEIILADEINRAPPKVQSALLEAMAEQQVTVGGETRTLPEMFFVLATQNPLEQAGTYPLPEAQMDRFMLHVVLDYPDAEQELEILRRDRARQFGQEAAKSESALTPEKVLTARRMVSEQYIAPPVEQYLVQLIAATRNLGDLDASLQGVLQVGASPRASIALLHASCAYAWLQGREFVTPDDIRLLVFDVLRHRLLLSFQGKSQGWTADKVIEKLLERVPVPMGEDA